MDIIHIIVIKFCKTMLILHLPSHSAEIVFCVFLRVSSDEEKLCASHSLIVPGKEK